MPGTPHPPPQIRAARRGPGIAQEGRGKPGSPQADDDSERLATHFHRQASPLQLRLVLASIWQAAKAHRIGAKSGSPLILPKSMGSFWQANRAGLKTGTRKNRLAKPLPKLLGKKAFFCPFSAILPPKMRMPLRLVSHSFSVLYATLSPSCAPRFKTGAIDHSATPPSGPHGRRIFSAPQSGSHFSSSFSRPLTCR